MSKADFDRLMQLNEDVTYQHAIERLFQASVYPDSPGLRKFGEILMVLALAWLLFAVVVWWLLLRSPQGTATSVLPPLPAASSSEIDMGAPMLPAPR